MRLTRRLVRAERDGADGARLYLDGGEIVTAGPVLVAAGRRAPVEGLWLDAADAAGVASEGGYVKVDGHLATTAPGVWAAGEVTGRLPFTHAADEMGRLAVADATSRTGRPRFDTAAIPWVTFTPSRSAGSG